MSNDKKDDEETSDVIAIVSLVCAIISLVLSSLLILDFLLERKVVP